MVDVAKATSEWHRRMTSKKLSQSGKAIDYKALIPGANVFFYKPPTAQEVERRGRKAKHLDHYTGPATIVRSIGTRSFVIQYTDGQGTTRTYQRDASMISLVPPTEIKGDPSDANLEEKAPHAHQSVALFPIEEGEYVILKDTKDANTWYCAQVLEKLPDRIKVSYLTTSILALPKYNKATYKQRLRRLQELVFLRTWTLSTGEATTGDPALSRKRVKLWTGQVPHKFLDDVLLVRHVGLTAFGNLTPATASLAAKLEIAHQVGA